MPATTFGEMMQFGPRFDPRAGGSIDAALEFQRQESALVAQQAQNMADKEELEMELDSREKLTEMANEIARKRQETEAKNARFQRFALLAPSLLDAVNNASGGADTEAAKILGAYQMGRGSREGSAGSALTTIQNYNELRDEVARSSAVPRALYEGYLSGTAPAMVPALPAFRSN